MKERKRGFSAKVLRDKFDLIQAMSAKKEVYYINSQGADSTSVKKGINWLLQFKSGYLAVNQNSNLDGLIAEVLGQQKVKELVKTGNTMINSTLLTLVTERKPVRISDPRPLAAFFVDTKFLDVLQSIPTLPAMLVVPWLLEEVKPWIRTVNAKDLDTPKNELPEELIKNGVIVQALRTLSALVNKSTGILHPLDRDSAIEIFKTLKNAGEDFTPEDAKAFLIREEGWKATYAQDVADIAQKVLEGKKLQYRSGRLRPDLLDIWRKEAEANKR